MSVGRRAALTRHQPAATALVLAGLALLATAAALHRVPVYLHHDEVLYALNGRSIGMTGRDLTGLRFPLFIHTFAWVPPIAIYSRAILFRFLPLSEVTTRLPGIVIGTIDVVLTYFVGRRLFRRESLAILSAVLVLLSPIHFLQARLGTDHLYSVPFALAFVLLLFDFAERRALGSLMAAHVCLGCGIYGYIGATAAVPVYVALACAWLFFALEIRTPRPYLAIAAGLIVAFLPLVPWFAAHPEQISDGLKAYDVTGATAATTAARQPRAEGSTGSAIVSRVNAYYNFFDPETLFFVGDPSVVDSTREVGVLLLPLAVLLPIGAYYSLTRRRTPNDVFVLLGLLVAPVGALIVPEVKVTRTLVLVPFAALVAARGVDALLEAPGSWRRRLAIGLLVGAFVQFGFFCHDYFTGYRERSSVWFGGNRAGAIDALVARADRTPTPALYVSRGFPMFQAFWQFYLIKDQRTDLMNRPVYFDQTLDLDSVPAGSVLLSESTGSTAGALDRSPALRRATVILDADEHSSYAIYEK